MQPGDDSANEERRPLSTDDLAATRADSDTDRDTDSAASDADRVADTRDYAAERTGYAQGQGPEQTSDLPSQHADPLPTGHQLFDDRTESAERSSVEAQAGERQRPTENQDEPSPALLPPGDTDKFQMRWHELQGVFVDDPPEAVRAADQLVAEVIQAVAASFGEHKHELERQWQRGESVSTEDLRLALRQYRSFFTRLLST